MRLLVASRQRRMGPASARRVRRTLSLRKLEQKARTTNPFAKQRSSSTSTFRATGISALTAMRVTCRCARSPGMSPRPVERFGRDRPRHLGVGRPGGLRTSRASERSRLRRNAYAAD